MKVLCHYAASPSFVHRFADLAPEGVELTVCPVEDLDRYYDLIAESEVLWHFLLPLTASMIDAGASLRLIQKIGIGVNMIDLDAARRHGIAVCNMPGTNAQAVAEATLLLMLGALRRAAQVDRATRAGDGWALQTALQDDSSEVAGRSVGLVGLGAVAQRLAPVLVALGARVLYVSRTPKPGAVGERVPLERLLAESDIVSLHLPLTSETERLIDAAAIARMKPGAVIVNTARGGLIDEAALVAALRDGRIAAAGLDVFEVEPASATNPLFTMDNVVVAPHLAWLTRETMERSLAVALENCRRLAAGDELLHRVV